MTDNTNNKDMMKKIYTLIFLKRNNNAEILLGRKTRGLGKGLWNGFGGKLESGETVEKCAAREVEEECNLKTEKLKHLGVVRYEIDNSSEISLIHVFTNSNFTGKEKPSEEMNPIRWFKVDEIPYDEMWPDAIEWHPYMFKEKYFSVHCFYNCHGTIRKNVIREHDDLQSALKLCF